MVIIQKARSSRVENNITYGGFNREGVEHNILKYNSTGLAKSSSGTTTLMFRETSNCLGTARWTTESESL